MGKRKQETVKAWCDECMDHTLHKLIPVTDFKDIDGETKKGAHTLGACLNDHNKRKAA